MSRQRRRPSCLLLNILRGLKGSGLEALAAARRTKSRTAFGHCWLGIHAYGEEVEESEALPLLDFDLSASQNARADAYNLNGWLLARLQVVNCCPAEFAVNISSCTAMSTNLKTLYLDAVWLKYQGP